MGAGGGRSRQGRELAEGQNNARVEPFLTALPLSASQENWRSGSNSSRNMHILTIWRCHLAEGVGGPKLIALRLRFLRFTHTHTQGARNCRLVLVQKPLYLRKGPKWRPQ